MTFSALVMSITEAASERLVAAHQALSWLSGSALVVFCHVLRLGRAQFQVLNAVVRFVAVNVMHGLTAIQRASEVLLHNDAVNETIFAALPNDEIATRQCALASSPRRASLTRQRSVVGGHAFTGAAKRLGLLGESLVGNGELTPTSYAGNSVLCGHVFKFTTIQLSWR
jgi:hypothetical protein